MGADRARETFIITTGTLIPEATYTISCMSMSPCEELPEKTRAPVAEAAIAAESTLCSDSTGRNSPFHSPLDFHSANFSMSSVWGEG
jgi:hypothetical protein